MKLSRKNFTHIVTSLLTLALFLSLAGLSGAAMKKRVIHSFQRTRRGQLPGAPVAIDQNGVLYGTTLDGGFNDGGVVYSLTPPSLAGGAWTESILHSFSIENSDGYASVAKLLVGADGILYGTTALGGAGGKGIVFALTPPSMSGGSWSETILHAFPDSDGDGAVPLSGVVAGADGTLYGTTFRGGLNSTGTVYSLTPPATEGASWTETILHSFGPLFGREGYAPAAGLAISSSGTLYGTTVRGGLFGRGAVFSLTPPSTSGGAWEESDIYSMGAYPTDGTRPSGPVMLASNGVLYGTTSMGGTGVSTSEPFGCGVVFSLTPPSSPGGVWVEAIIRSFVQHPDGCGPRGGLLLGNGGAIFGAAFGIVQDAGHDGTIFTLRPPSTTGGAWSLAVTPFGGAPSDGAFPVGGLVAGKDGLLYGVSANGGANNAGAVFQVKP